MVRRLVLAFVLGCTAVIPAAPAARRQVDLVDPRIDTFQTRWLFFASASRPFGMVSLSPDTKLDGDWGAGRRGGRPAWGGGRSPGIGTVVEEIDDDGAVAEA